MSNFREHWKKVHASSGNKKGYKKGYQDGYECLYSENVQLRNQLARILNILQGETDEPKEICNRGGEIRGREKEHQSSSN